MNFKIIIIWVKKIFDFIKKRRFLLVISIFVIWILIFDKNSIINQIKNKKKLNQLKTEKQYYLDKIKTDSTKLYELQTDNDNLEKFAREQYYMHKENEEVFIVVEK